jgi:dye decolorizing peroxidase
VRGASRRTVLLSGLTGLGGAGAAAALGGCSAGAGPAGTGPGPAGATTVARAFRGARQAGVVERPQAHAAFVALDLAPGADRDAVRRLLTVWTDDIERLMAGRGPLTDGEPELAAVPASLTVTVGVGRRVVEATGAEVPAWLAPLPAFRVDRLQERWSGGDVVLQVCADSPVTVAHATRRLVTGGAPMVRARWVQRGFREPFEGAGVPMRNLFGQVDGTVQPALDGADDALLWVGTAGPAWLRDGSALVLRRIAMDLDRWDTVDRVARENAVGRRLSDGAPVTAPAGAGAGATMDLAAVDPLGLPVVDEAAHVRRAHAAAPHERFLRRPYSYDEGGADAGGAGLLFAAYCADPVRQLLPVQRRLAEKDLLNLWTTPVGSVVVAVLPGAREGEVLGEAMLG